MAKTNYQTIDEYHQAYSGQTLDRMQTIRKIIHQEVLGVEECISYQIPCFKYLGYLIYYAAYPKHISLSTPYSEAFWEHFKADLGVKKQVNLLSRFQLRNGCPKS